MSVSGLFKPLFNTLSNPPFMPWSWWVVIVLVCFLGLYFGFDAFRAVYRWLCDITEKIIKPHKDNIFNLYGVHLFVGRVGKGKTISMVRRAQRLKQKYPNLKIMANFHTDIADGYINTWRDILETENIDEKTGINHGVLFLFDEIHLTFDSQSWRDAPCNLLEYISLQRHFHKCIFGTAQVFTRVNKVIREQSDFVVECNTYFGNRLVRNKIYTMEDYQVNAELKDSGVRKRHYLKKFCYYASDKLRALYDTEEIVSSIDIGMSRKDYKDISISA